MNQSLPFTLYMTSQLIWFPKLPHLLSPFLCCVLKPSQPQTPSLSWALLLIFLLTPSVYFHLVTLFFSYYPEFFSLVISVLYSLTTHFLAYISNFGPKGGKLLSALFAFRIMLALTKNPNVLNIFNNYLVNWIHLMST